MLAAEWNSCPTILESDCSTVIKYLDRPTSQGTAYGFIVSEAVEASRRLPRVIFQHVGRESNVLAHELAQLAVRLNHSAVWSGRFPVCVEHCVAQDVNAQVIELISPFSQKKRKKRLLWFKAKPDRDSVPLLLKGTSYI